METRVTSSQAFKHPLPPEKLLRRCDLSGLPFETTDDLTPLDQPLGQERAVAAIRFAIGMKGAGYNLFALGPDGTGKISLVRRFLEHAAATQAPPDDWVYVHHFQESHRPRALRLPPGRGPELKKTMERLVEDLCLTLPAAFDGEEYRHRRHDLDEQFKESQDATLHAMQAEAAKKGIAVIRTPVGLALAPLKEGEVLSPDDFQALPEDEQIRLKAVMESLQEELEEKLADLPLLTRRQRDKVRALDRETAEAAVAHSLQEARRDWAEEAAVLAYLDEVREEVLDTLEDFIAHEDGPRPAQTDGDSEDEGGYPRSASGSHLRRFRVNVLVTTSNGGGAPVVYEDHPTQPNLVGRIEHLAQMGALITDFNLIKAGALHRANGGYLLLEARKLLMNPFAWEDLKRALRAREIRVESPGQSMGLLSTVSLEPEAIPLDVKVVLVGDPMLYYLLSQEDPDFSELFKVAADFDYQMDNSGDTVLGLARLMAGMVQSEGLKPMTAAAIGRVVEYAGRLAEDSTKLTTHISSIVGLVREADYWAGEERAARIEAAHVQAAIEAQIFRHDRVRGHVLEEIVDGTLLIDTDGEKVGQVNGLVVMQLGTFSFGRPSRITSRIHLGRGELIDIEREVDLGGPIHSKGVMILSSFLAGRFAQDQPLTLSASLVFEQSYGEVEGDSASSAELYCLLSGLADAPVRQGFAVTGSVNQYGQVQAIGGVNEKIEGHYDICRMRGLNGHQGVIIPASNVRHLMLRPDVVEACAQGRFHIHAVETIDQGIELLTGMPAGEADEHGQFPAGSINRRVAAKLALFARKLRAFHQEGGTASGTVGRSIAPTGRD
ncbi:Lon protease [mine drainage metagenome]|uniref:Lon protease n=1 Tax=mine drainage metagenome TaxID=410659 RepID=A0A1J5SMF6_9ZZZZ